MDGWLLLAVGLAVAAMDFVVGFNLSRTSAEPRPDGSPRDPEGARRAGRLLMLAAPVFLLVFVALALGWIPVDGIAPIGGGS